MRFNFRGVYISRICNFRVFQFAGAEYSGVEIFTGEIFADVFRHVLLVPLYLAKFPEQKVVNHCQRRVKTVRE